MSCTTALILGLTGVVLALAAVIYAVYGRRT
jgi:hypothetical protein